MFGLLRKNTLGFLHDSSSLIKNLCLLTRDSLGIRVRSLSCLSLQPSPSYTICISLNPSPSYTTCISLKLPPSYTICISLNPSPSYTTCISLQLPPSYTICISLNPSPSYARLPRESIWTSNNRTAILNKFMLDRPGMLPSDTICSAMIKIVINVTKERNANRTSCKKLNVECNLYRVFYNPLLL